MKKRIGVLLCLMWSMILIGCSASEKAEDEMYIYYVSSEGYALAPEVFPKMEIDEALEKLKNPDILVEGRTAIPDNIEIEEYELNNNQLILSFDEEYLSLPKSTEVLLRAAIVQTMVQMEEVTFVAFYVGEEPLKDSDGNPIGLMRAEDFVQNTGYVVNAYQTTDLTLYFSNAKGKLLRTGKKNDVHYNTNTSIEKLVVEQLMKSASTETLYPTIPKSTKLLGVSVKDGICYVNFDSKFSTDGYDQNPEVTIYSIVNSVIANGNVSKVQILIDGSSELLYKGTVDLSQPLEWRENLIEVVE